MHGTSWAASRRRTLDIRVFLTNTTYKESLNRFVTLESGWFSRLSGCKFVAAHHVHSSIFSVLQLAPTGRLYGRFHFQVFSSPPNMSPTGGQQVHSGDARKMRRLIVVSGWLA